MRVPSIFHKQRWLFWRGLHTFALQLPSWGIITTGTAFKFYRYITCQEEGRSATRVLQASKDVPVRLFKGVTAS